MKEAVKYGSDFFTSFDYLDQNGRSRWYEGVARGSGEAACHAMELIGFLTC
jgi:hypothetical protein